MTEGQGGDFDKTRNIFGQNRRAKKEPPQNGQPTVPTAWDTVAYVRRMRVRHGLPPTPPPTASKPPQGK